MNGAIYFSELTERYKYSSELTERYIFLRINGVKACGGPAKSPLLHRRYKNFDGISGKDDSKLDILYFIGFILYKHGSVELPVNQTRWSAWLNKSTFYK